ncbi:MAG: chemotaxis protein CheW [Proteobacteria bacterium]|nr:chemotaxis protein CheW [Pseudomonadota bacterium]
MSEETAVTEEVKSELDSTFVQLVVFEIDTQLLGIEVSKVREVVKFSQLTKTPGSSDLIEGIIELREGIIPVVDLRRRLGIVSEASFEKTNIVITEIGDYIFGFIVDRVDKVSTFAISDFMLPPPGATMVGKEFIIGVTKKNGNLLLYLDIDNVLNIEELMGGLS